MSLLSACPGPQDHLCGDAIVQGDETCDDGNQDEDDGCTTLCHPARCGDGLLSGEEDCDDGNADDQDACTSACQIARCGDGIRRLDLSLHEDGYEACDSDGEDRCTEDCRRPYVRWNQVVMGGSDSGAVTCGFDSLQQGRCWGNNRYAVVDGPGEGDRLLPGPVFETAPSGIALGGGHLCRWDENGSGLCWGLGTAGQSGPLEMSACPGTGREQCHLQPNPIPLPGIVLMDAGLAHSCAQTSAGLSCWGANNHGQLGDPARQAESRQPVRVADLEGLQTFATGGYHSCAVVTGGAVKCFGRNAEGQVGNGSNQDVFVPVAVSDLSDIQTLALGERHSCARSRAGDVYCWGYNGHGQVGSGEIASPRRCDHGQSARNHCHQRPNRVPDLAPSLQIAAGSRHSCSLGEAGTVHCWGDNRRGQLGDGTASGAFCTPPDGGDEGCQPRAVAVLELFDIQTISAGHEASCAVASDGVMSCWGRNSWGQLGLGDREDRHQSAVIQVH